MSCLVLRAFGLGECFEELITVGLLSPPFYPRPQAIIKKHLAPLSFGRVIRSLVGMARIALNNAFMIFACPLLLPFWRTFPSA
jgi:hypothetical protein